MIFIKFFIISYTNAVPGSMSGIKKLEIKINKWFEEIGNVRIIKTYQSQSYSNSIYNNHITITFIYEDYSLGVIQPFCGGFVI